MPNSKSNHGKILLWISIGSMLVAFSMFGVTLRNKAIQFMNRQQAPAAIAPTVKGSVQPEHRLAAPAPPPPAQPSKPDLVATASMRRYTGKWIGEGVNVQGVWILKLEITDSVLQPGVFSGYATWATLPIGPAAASTPNRPINPMAFMAKMLPQADILAGENVPDGISFHRTKDTQNPDKCVLKSLKVTPFGQNQLLAEWERTGCGDGEALMTVNKGE